MVNQEIAKWLNQLPYCCHYVYPLLDVRFTTAYLNARELMRDNVRVKQEMSTYH